MGNKKKYEPKYLKYLTDYDTDHFTCNNCPAKIFFYDNKVKAITEGLGNISSNTMIILPTWVSIDPEKFDKVIDIINNAYKQKYSISCLNTVYITPIIKCFYKHNIYNINNTVLEKCACKTISELSRRQFIKKIIYLGDSKQLRIIIPNNYLTNEIACSYKILEDDEYAENFIDALLMVL